MTPPQSPTRSFQSRSPNQNSPRGRGQGCWTCGKLGCHSLLHRQNVTQPAQQPRPLGQSPVNSPQLRRRNGCHVCGRFGCHTVFHGEQRLGTDGGNRLRDFSPLPVSLSATDRRRPESGNDPRNPSSGTRAPQNQ